MLSGSASANSGMPPQTAVLMDIETKLAEASMTRVELRDIEKQYNKFSKDELAKLAPAIDWEAYFEAAHIVVPEQVIVCQPNFIVAVNRFFAELPLDMHKAYLRWHILNDFSHCLDDGAGNGAVRFLWPHVFRRDRRCGRSGGACRAS